jgi:hypothetical protein
MGAIFSSNESSKIWFPQISLEITFKNKVSAGIFSLGTFYVSFFPGNLVEPILLPVFLLEAFFLTTNSQKISFH